MTGTAVARSVKIDDRHGSGALGEDSTTGRLFDDWKTPADWCCAARQLVRQPRRSKHLLDDWWAIRNWYYARANGFGDHDDWKTVR